MKWGSVFLTLSATVGMSIGDGTCGYVQTHAAVHQGVTHIKKPVYLTFDDGPHPIYTAKILNILKRQHIRATFFILGSRATQYPDLVRQIYREGNEIGSHGYYHEFIVHKPKAWVESDITKTDKVLETLCGEKPKYFRPPGGILSKSDLALVVGAGHSIAMWTLDTNDWKHIPSSKILSSVMKGVKPNSIILMHDGLTTSDNTVKALPLIISALQKRGYTFDVLPKQFQGTSIGGTTDSNNYRFKTKGRR